jgi:hypothetical protein
MRPRRRFRVPILIIGWLGIGRSAAKRISAKILGTYQRCLKFGHRICSSLADIRAKGVWLEFAAYGKFVVFLEKHWGWFHPLILLVCSAQAYQIILGTNIDYVELFKLPSMVLALSVVDEAAKVRHPGWPDNFKVVLIAPIILGLLGK